MIVNDSYSLFLRHPFKIQPGGEVTVTGTVEHRFAPDRVEVSRRHGRMAFTWQEVRVNGVVRARAGEPLAIGEVSTGARITITGRNMSQLPAIFDVMVAGPIVYD